MSKALLLVVLAGLGLPAPARAATAFRMPAPEIRVLDNGLRVAFFQDSRLPLAQVLLLVPAGSSSDPPGESGVAYLTAEMLRRGTSSRDAATYAAELDRLAASVATSATRDYSTVAAAFLARDLEAGLEIMSDAVIRPSFDAAELEKLVGQTISTYGQLRREPANFTAEQTWAAVFAGHPYARPTFGAPGDLRRLPARALRAFYGNHWRPDRATLAIAGDLTADRAFAAAAEWFGRWEGTAVPAVDRPFALDRAAGGGRMRILLFDAPELATAELRLALATPGRGHEDETALSLASAIFGGGPASRLARLAADPSFGREARSAQVAQRDAGIFTLGVTIAPDSAARAVRRLADELRRFVAQPPEEAEIAAARRLALQVLPMQFETLGAILTHWSTSQFYGLPDNAYDRHRERLARLTGAEVSAAAGRWLDADRLVVVAVGPAAKLRRELEQLGSVEVVASDAPAPAPVPAEPPVVRDAPPTREEQARGREVVRQALVAHGGLARLKGIKDSTVEADATLHLGGQELAGHMVQVRKEPGMMLFATSIQGIETTQTLNGDRAWSVNSALADNVPQDLDSLAVRGLKAVFRSDLPHLLLEAADTGSRVASRGRRKLGDREADAVEVRTGARRQVLYFDPRTHHLLAQDEQDGSGEDYVARRVYADLRTVQGVLWPFSEERLLAGERVMKLTLTRVALDSGVDDSIFEKPEPALPPPVR